MYLTSLLLMRTLRTHCAWLNHEIERPQSKRRRIFVAGVSNEDVHESPTENKSYAVQSHLVSLCLPLTRVIPTLIYIVYKYLIMHPAMDTYVTPCTPSKPLVSPTVHQGKLGGPIEESKLCMTETTH